MPDEKVRAMINHLLVNNEHSFSRVVYAQISHDQIGLTVFTDKKQLRFKQWNDTFEKLWNIKLDTGTTAKSIENMHKIITDSPAVQTLYALGYVPQSNRMSFSSVVSSVQIQAQAQSMQQDVSSFVQVKVARTDSVASPGAAAAAIVESVETKAEEPPPAPIETPSKPPPTSSFNVDMERAFRKARELITSKQCFSKFKDFSTIPVDQYLPNYISRKKEIMNVRDSPVELCIKAFIPEVVKTSRTSNFESIVSSLSDEDHKKTLASIRKWYLFGMHSFYPWPYSEEFIYNFDKLIAGKCSIFEVQRRIMTLEELVAKLTKYIYEVMNKKPNVSHLSKPVVQKAGLVLASGSGLLGVGENFWTLNEKMKTVRASVDFASAMASQAEFGNNLKYLMENRASAMTRHGLIAAGELAWGIPFLAFFVEARDLVTKLSEKDYAVELWARIQRFEDARKKVHVADLLPMIKYGDTLTAYCKSLHEICKTLKSIGSQNKIEFPKGIDMVVLNNSGQIVGPSGEGLKFGHLEAVTKPVIIPFPPNIAKDLAVENPVAIKEKFTAYYLGETKSVHDMLEVIGLDSGDEKIPIALQMMRIERENIIKILNTDSHSANRTHVLPPTASLPMPLANYMPLKIYAAKSSSSAVA
jgi:hypothetical protein